MDLLLATWPQVEAYLTRSRTIIVPLGSVEQHGPAGLIGTDSLCARAVAEGLAAAADALVGPAIPFGVAPFNLGFPGTISARATTLMALLEDYVLSLARQGFERFYFLNGHGGNIGPIRAACLDLQARQSLLPEGGARPLRFRLRSWWEYPAVDALRRDWYGAREGMHATPSEVAITQALHPDHARPHDLPPPESLSGEFLRDHAGDNHLDAEAHRRRFPDGRVGSDSSLATPAQGRQLLTTAVMDAVADYRAFLAEP
jgi:creatinine amidohydrolase